MTEAQAFFLGVLQGLTEFLPISSSGHLVLAEEFLGLHMDPQAMLGINVLLHAGTLLALLVVYWKRWWSIMLSPFNGDKAHQKIFLLLIIATVPAVVVGLLFGKGIAERFSSAGSLSMSFLATAVVLWIGEHFQRQSRAEHLSSSNAFFVGTAQAFALIPGLSRSGLTMSAGRAVGLTRQESLDFSFLMAVPVIAGAATLTCVQILQTEIVLPDINTLIIGFLAAFIASVLAVLFLRQYVQRYSLSWFSLYLVGISIAILLRGS